MISFHVRYLNSFSLFNTGFNYKRQVFIALLKFHTHPKSTTCFPKHSIHQFFCLLFLLYRGFLYFGLFARAVTPIQMTCTILISHYLFYMGNMICLNSHYFLSYIGSMKTIQNYQQILV